MALTTEQIHKVADQLHADGIKPTLAEVRKALGGGSFTTISDAMKSWRQEQQTEQQLQQIDLPSSIDERLKSLGAEMWQSAINIANERLTAEREALAVAQAKAQAETDEAQEAVKMLEDENKDLLQELDKESEKAEEAVSQRDKALTEANELKLQLATLQGENKAQQKQIDTLIAEREKLASRVEELTITLARN